MKEILRHCQTDKSLQNLATRNAKGSTRLSGRALDNNSKPNEDVW
jgi:hypothetical protein